MICAGALGSGASTAAGAVASEAGGAAPCGRRLRLSCIPCQLRRLRRCCILVATLVARGQDRGDGARACDLRGCRRAFLVLVSLPFLVLLALLLFFVLLLGLRRRAGRG